MVNNENRGNPKTDLAYRKKKNAEDMRYQVISFGLMIGLTLVAFLTVASDAGVWFTVPFILLLAVIQVAFQLYYFMHMSQRGMKRRLCSFIRAFWSLLLPFWLL